ncbi:SgrR family transcriptional regulator [Vibrio maerlii]|uniref:SgrR family transcriptional regulator n=1 Tax=Vibrio maerlii TaxID=2231648 RepID=UPI000E3D0A4C|nr:SgrR family transcriptional regulator [Vibrio maerlii]
MSDLNLYRYYSRLETLGVGQEIKTTLQEVSEKLFTSTRHARSLLGQMQNEQWLTWSPKAGRNNRSTLLLHFSVDTLTERLAAERINQGKYEKALEILGNDQTKFGRLLKSTSGASMREGRLNIQLTYKRPFERIVPHQRHRSSERFFLRQVFSCLISSDAQGRLHPDLAHHWRYNPETLEWTFYLRPNLTFHNGSSIDSGTISALFNKLKSHKNYQAELAHLESVTAPNPLKVIFKLNKADMGFGGLLSGVKYGVQPVSQVNNAQTTDVIGSGCFEVIEHTEKRMVLQAFDQYYGCRVLADNVTVWIVSEDEPESKSSITSNGVICGHYISMPRSANNHSGQQTRTEDGSLFALYNANAKQPLNEAQRRYFTTLIQPELLLDALDQQNALFGIVPASNIFPQWQPVLRTYAQPVSFSQTVTIAGYDYTALKRCADAIKQCISSLKVEVEIHLYSFRELINKAQKGELEETLIVTNINLDDNRQASAFNNFYNNPVLHHCLGKHRQKWLLEQLEELRGQEALGDYLDKLEPVISPLVNEYWITPMFHHMQTLRFHGVLEDVALTNWGWPDIKSVWLAD